MALPLSEEEEFELLSLERERGLSSAKPREGWFDYQSGLKIPQWLEDFQKVGQAKDPVEMGAYETGGKVTDLLAEKGLTKLAPLAGFATNVGIQAAVPLAAGEVGKAVSPLFEKTAKHLMQSAVKPLSTDLSTGKGQRAIQTMLDKRIMPTEGGMGALRKEATQLNDEVASIVKSASEAGVTIDKGVVASRLQDVVSRIEKTSMNPQSSLASVEKIYTEVMENGLIPKNMPVSQAQQLKMGIYSMLKKKYGELGSDSVEAQKALARGLKEEIEKVVPDVVSRNAKASELWNALNVAERRQLLDLNRNPLNMALLAHNPASFTVYMADKSAPFKGVTAILLNEGKEQIPANAVRFATTAYEVSKQKQEQR